VDHVVAVKIAAVAVGAALVAVGALAAFAKVAGGATAFAVVATDGRRERQRGNRNGMEMSSLHGGG
jgi:hypothetical protein